MTCHAHALARSRRFLVAADVDLIQETIRSLPKRKILNVVDIGAGAGTTSLAAFEAGPDVRVWCYDHDIDALNWAEQAVVNIGKRDDWVKCETWGQLEESRRPRRIDFAMIDHEHSYSAVKEAVEWVRRRLKRRGRIWIHDFANPRDFGLASEPTPGVAKAIREAIDVHDGVFKVEAEAGLGIVLALR